MALLMRPLDQFLIPFDTVFVPVLSRLQDQPERYRRTFLQIYDALVLVSFLMAGLFLGLSRPLVLALLGLAMGGSRSHFRRLGHCRHLLCGCLRVPVAFDDARKKPGYSLDGRNDLRGICGLVRRRFDLWRDGSSPGFFPERVVRAPACLVLYRGPFRTDKHQGSLACLIKAGPGVASGFWRSLWQFPNHVSSGPRYPAWHRRSGHVGRRGAYHLGAAASTPDRAKSHS